MEADPLFQEYVKKITDKGFFKGLEEGSKGAYGRGCMYIYTCVCTCLKKSNKNAKQ